MAQKKKYYVIWQGHKTGVFDSWNTCKKHIKDFSGAQYKSFTSLKLAEDAYKGNYFEYVGKKDDPKSNYLQLTKY